MLLLTGLSSQPARADDPAFFAFSGGWFDFNRQKKESGELTVEYRDANKFWIFKPMGGIMANSDGGGAAYAGVLVDLYFGNRLVLTPSFAPGVYLHGASKDLGGPIEFRSQVELSYRFDDHTVEAGPNDMLHIPAGPAHRHKPKVVGTEVVRYVLTEFS